jgi:quercetin dioxygenase-like cupin family protein
MEGQAQAQAAAPGEAPALVPQDEMAWGPAPDAFPQGVGLCVLHGDPFAQGQVFTVRLKAASGVVFAPHRHPHDEHITIVSGGLVLGNGARLERAGSRQLGPGDYAFLPREQFHYAWADGDTVFQVSAVGPFGITYADPNDDPRNAATTKH